jgi:hypothetical protein
MCGGLANLDFAINPLIVGCIYVEWNCLISRGSLFVLAEVNPVFIESEKYLIQTHTNTRCGFQQPKAHKKSTIKET